MKQYFVTRKFLMLSAALIAALMLQMVAAPITARADDGTPPPPTEEQVTPVDPATSTDGVVPPASDATTVVPVDVPTPETIDEGTVPVSGDAPTVDTVIGALPENVDLVVVGIDGQPEPLASQAAAEALVNSDPFWCPEGTDPNGGGCTSYTTFIALLSGLQGISTLTNGTVYVQAGNYSGPESQITFNGNTLTNIGNLSLIGGWNLVSGPYSQVGVTTFDIPVSVINWTHDVSVEDIVIDGATGSGLTVKTTEEVSVDDVIAVNNTKDGVHIEAGDSVTVTNVQADHNGADGIDISSNTNTGTISLTSIQTNHNADDGIRIYSKQKSNITLKDITSDYNGGDGLDLQSPKEAITCSYSEVFVPAGTTQDVWPYANVVGPTLVVTRQCAEPTRQSLSINNSEFSHNDGNGIRVYTTGNFQIGGMVWGTSPVVTNNNGQDGTNLYFFANTDTFPWAYYKNHAQQLAGGPAKIIALGYVEETGPFLGTFESGNNGGQDYVYYTDGPGMACGFSDDHSSYYCVSPPSPTPIAGGEEFSLDSGSNSGQGSGSEPLCSKNSIVILQLPTNDNVTVFCPISGQITVKNVGKKGLPTSAPEGTTFVSALDVKLTKNGTPVSVIEDGGHLKVSFVIPADLAGKNFVILYWDATAGKWVELPAFADNGGTAVVTDLGNGKQVLEGTKVLADVGLVEASVNFPGTFMLVAK